ncbi:MAG: hypothetical protein KC503_33450 [Myxococcales bacterium]|nr:hypothetical protein [Myxococcales bacterium]
MHKSIALFAGDGAGRDQLRVVRCVLEAVAARFGHQLSLIDALFGAAAQARRGHALPEETRLLARDVDALFIAFACDAVPRSYPDADAINARRAATARATSHLALDLDAGATLRPVHAYPSSSDIAALRPELARAVDLLVVHPPAAPSPQRDALFDVERARRSAITAFQMAQRRRRRLTCVDRGPSDSAGPSWRSVVDDLARRFADVRVDHLAFDDAGRRLLEHPRRFDVIVTSALLGELLGDQAALLAGSLGLQGTATVGGRTDLYAPTRAETILDDGDGPRVINPVGSVAAVALCLEHSLGMPDEARAVSDAIQGVLALGYYTADLRFHVPRHQRGLVDTRGMRQLLCHYITHGHSHDDAQRGEDARGLSS